MEKNLICKFTDRKEFNVVKYVRSTDDRCHLLVSNQEDVFVCKNLPLNEVVPLLKKYNWFFRLLWGKKYSSNYVIKVLPYFDRGWKTFIWQEGIDNNIILEHKDIPLVLKNFFASYSQRELLFKQKLEDLIKSFSGTNAGPLLLDLYWKVIETRFSDRKDVLNILHLFWKKIASERCTADTADKPISVARYLYKTQYLMYDEIDYATLARDYFHNIYEYLHCCYCVDVLVLNDLYGDTNNIKSEVHLLEAENLLILFGAVKDVIECLDFE